MTGQSWRSLIDQAKSAVADNENVRAAEILAQAAEIAGDDHDSHFETAEIYFDLSDYDQAEAHYRTALGKDPENADSLFGLAATLRVQESYAESVALYEQAFALEPDRTGAYWELGYAQEMNGDTESAALAYRECLHHYPDHGMALHLLAAMTGETTDRAPQDYVADLFNDYALSFESELVDDLEYTVPSIIRDYLGGLPGDQSGRAKHYGRALDLGCGTGLVAEALAGRVGTIDGVDLSENMIDVARREERYQATHVMDAGEFLADRQMGHASYDLIVAGDVLVYLGELADLFDGVRSRLAGSGDFIFTVEAIESGAPFKLLPSGRYAHSRLYIEELSNKSGLKLVAINPIVPRTDSGVNIDGLLCHFTQS